MARRLAIHWVTVQLLSEWQCQAQVLVDAPSWIGAAQPAQPFIRTKTQSPRKPRRRHSFQPRFRTREEPVREGGCDLMASSRTSLVSTSCFRTELTRVRFLLILNPAWVGKGTRTTGANGGSGCREQSLLKKPFSKQSRLRAPDSGIIGPTTPS